MIVAVPGDIPVTNTISFEYLVDDKLRLALPAGAILQRTVQPAGNTGIVGVYLTAKPITSPTATVCCSSTERKRPDGRLGSAGATFTVNLAYAAVGAPLS